MILVCAVVACSVGTWLGFILLRLFAHDNYFVSYLGVFLILPLVAIRHLLKESEYYWFVFGVLQLAYYYILVLLAWLAFIRLRRKMGQ